MGTRDFVCNTRENRCKDSARRTKADEYGDMEGTALELDALLMGVLSEYPKSLQACSDPEALGNAGGLSGARIWRYESGVGTVAVRAWPQHRPERQTLERIHARLAEAAFLEFVPSPHAARDGATIQEAGSRFWEVSPWMPGEADPGRPPPMAKLSAGFLALGELHRAWARHRVRGPSRGIIIRVQEIGALRDGGFDELERAVPPHDDPRCDLARRWLTVARSLAPRVLRSTRSDTERDGFIQPCVRDVRPDHLLFRGETLSGLIDYGALAVDSVAHDLARLLTEWVGPNQTARAEALAAYESARPLDLTERALIGAFERTMCLLMGSYWIRWHFVQRRSFDDSAAVLLGLGRANRRVDELANMID